MAFPEANPSGCAGHKYIGSLFLVTTYAQCMSCVSNNLLPELANDRAGKIPGCTLGY